MRKIESYLIYAGMFLLLPFSFIPTTFLAYLIILLLALHFLVEFPRWQLVLAYFVTATAAYNALTSENGLSFGWLRLCVYWLLLLAASALACLFPVPKLPALSGPFKTIITSTVHIPVFLKSGQKEVLCCTFYYPADLSEPKQQGAKYISLRDACAVADFAKLPRFLFSSLPLVRLRALDRKQASSLTQKIIPPHVIEKLPVVVYSHGLGGVREIYSIFCQDLASQGCVCISLTHQDASAAIAECFPPELHDDEELFSQTHNINLSGNNPNQTEKQRYLAYRALDLSKGETILGVRQPQLFHRVEEVSALLDYVVEKEKTKWPAKMHAHWANRLDLHRVVLAGHSFGGQTALTTAATIVRDRRAQPQKQYSYEVRAVIGHDIWMEPIPDFVFDEAKQQSPIPFPPFFSINGQSFYVWKENFSILERFFSCLAESQNSFSNSSSSPENSSSNSYSQSLLCVLKETAHSNFCDIVCFGALASQKLGAAGKNDIKKVYRLINGLDAAYLRSLQLLPPVQKLITSTEATIIKQLQQLEQQQKIEDAWLKLGLAHKHKTTPPQTQDAFAADIIYV